MLRCSHFHCYFTHSEFLHLSRISSAAPAVVYIFSCSVCCFWWVSHSITFLQVQVSSCVTDLSCWMLYYLVWHSVTVTEICPVFLASQYFSSVFHQSFWQLSITHSLKLTNYFCHNWCFVDLFGWFGVGFFCFLVGWDFLGFLVLFFFFPLLFCKCKFVCFLYFQNLLFSASKTLGI